MNIARFDISGPLLLTPKAHADARGIFVETWVRERFDAAVGQAVEFVQDNQSVSHAPGTVRGLHYQAPPRAQGKLVRCVRGAVVDIAVDARRGSPTYGQNVRARLDGVEGEQLWVPEGFLHGFCTLEPDTVVAYKTTDTYAPEQDGAVRFDDPDLALDWGVEPAHVSDKDRAAPRFADWVSPFAYGDAP